MLEATDLMMPKAASHGQEDASAHVADEGATGLSNVAGQLLLLPALDLQTGKYSLEESFTSERRKPEVPMFEAGTVKSETADQSVDVAVVTTNRKREHWEADDVDFRHVEFELRKENLKQGARDLMDNGWSRTQLFFSHCWRDKGMQRMKRRLFSAMTKGGAVFWADFLDLQAQGPVPWRSEIGHAIQGSSKVVCLIDTEYLLSFNCLEELDYAINASKPIVPVVLDQGAWNLLTVIDGVEEAWNAQPQGDGCLPLSRYEGQAFGHSGQPFGPAALQKIFKTLSSINFCPCRDLDIANIGVDGVIERLQAFVQKDLQYTKEHAFLLTQAEGWLAADKSSNLLLERQADVNRWVQWMAVAERAQFFPPPTDLQKEYVAYSERRRHRQAAFLRAMGFTALGFILALLVGVSILAFTATNQKDEAVRSSKVSSALVLTTNTAPEFTSESRAVLRAAETSESIGFPALTAAALQDTVMHLLQKPYWFFDLNIHSARPTSLTFSPDGRYVASGAHDATVVVTYLPEGATLGGVPVIPQASEASRLQVTGEVYSLAWSPSGEFLACGCGLRPSGAQVILWRRVGGGSSRKTGHDFLVKWEEVYRHPGEEVRSLRWSPNSDTLAVGDERSNLNLWFVDETNSTAEPPKPRIHFVFGEPVIDGPVWGPVSRVRGVAWSPDGSMLAVGGTTESFYVYDAQALQNPLTLEPMAKADTTEDVNELAWSPDGKLLVAAEDKGIVSVWGLQNLEAAGVGSPSNRTGTMGMDMGNMKADEYYNKTLASMVLLQSMTDHGLDVVSVAWSSASELASTSHDGTVHLYRLDLTRSTEPKLVLQETLVSPNGIPDQVRFAPGRPGLLMATSRGNSIRGWQLAGDLGDMGPQSFRVNCIQEIQNAYNEEFSIRGASWTLDGNKFVASSYRGHVCLLQREAGSAEFEVTALLDILKAPERGPDKSKQAIRAVTFSSSGTLVAAGDDEAGIHVWRQAEDGSWGERATSQFFQDIICTKIREVHFSPDERLVAGPCHEGTLVVVWDYNLGRRLLLEAHTDRVRAVAWRPEVAGNGCQVLASAGNDLTIRIWEVCSDETGDLVAHECAMARNVSSSRGIEALAWSSNGPYLASGGDGGVVLIHQYRQGHLKQVQELPGHTSLAHSISWSPSGDQLATASDDNTVRIWDLTSDQTRRGKGYTAWVIQQRCSWIEWLSRGSTPRLACGRSTIDSTAGAAVNTLEQDPFSLYVMYFMLDLKYQLEILKALTFGDLNADDLQILGYSYIDDVVLE